MDAPTTWLKAQLETVKGELEKAHREFDRVQNQVQKLQKRYEACTEMLAVAESEQVDKEIDEIVAQTTQQVKKPTQTMPDQMEDLLETHGPLTSSELCDMLKILGRPKTSINSINTQLGRYKPARFNKNEEGKWYLVPKEPKTRHLKI